MPWVFHFKYAVNKWLQYKGNIINTTEAKQWCVKDLLVITELTFWICGYAADVGRSHIFMQRTCRAVWKGSFWLWASKPKPGKIPYRSSIILVTEISSLELSER